jgi:hypothetical protein
MSNDIFGEGDSTDDEDSIYSNDKRKDDIKHLLEEMNKFSEIQDYEKAKETLDRIKEELNTIIKKNGVLGLCDGVVPTIMVDHVPLDIPRLIVMTKGRSRK